MRVDDPVVIQGTQAVDDGLQIDCSSPPGTARFQCPDCAGEIVFHAPGLLICTCPSVFRAERLSWAQGRVHYSIRRATH